MTTVREFAINSALNGCSTAKLRPLDDQIVALLLTAVNNGNQEKLVRCDDIPGGAETAPYPSFSWQPVKFWHRQSGKKARS